MSEKYALRGIDTLIAQGCQIEGDLLFQGGLRIDGHVQGHVKGCAQTGATGHAYLVLGRSGRISGAVWAGDVLIDGLVEGNLHITGRVELLSRARIIGDIHYMSLSMQPGATVTGQLCPDAGNCVISNRDIKAEAHELKLA
jgi:cytoskeletal protein CcmA (bactofilin family)